MENSRTATLLAARMFLSERFIEAGARGVLSKMVPVRETAETVQRLIGVGRSTG
jgi:DNA-binding NarL/FixJ family response regulator